MLRLRNRFLLVIFLLGSLLGLLAVGPADAGPLDKTRAKSRDRQGPSPDRDRSATASRDGGDRLQSRDRSANRSRERSVERPTEGTARSSGRELPDGVLQPNPQQQANLQELRDSLSVLAGGASAAEDEIRGLAQDLQGMALQPPDPVLTQALAADLADALADASLSPREMAELTQSVYAVMNSAGLSQSELEVLKDDIEAILSASGADRSDVEAVLDDLQAIYDASAAGGGSSSTKRARGSKLGRNKLGRQ